MKNLKLFLPAILCLSLCLPVARAGDVWEKANSNEYGEKALGMLGRGFVNVGSCFVDLAVQTVEKTQQEPPFIGTLTGLASGAGCTVLRAGSGILDVASFWVPDFHGIPVSRSYSDCLASDEPQESYEPPVRTAPAAAPAVSKPEALKTPRTEPKVEKKHDPMQYIKK